MQATLERLGIRIVHARGTPERDIPILVEMGERYARETWCGPGGMTFDRAKTFDMMRHYVTGGDVIALLALRHGEPIGFLIGDIQGQYTVERIMDVFAIYVLPGFRNLPAGRAMMTEAVDFAHKLGDVAAVLFGDNLFTDRRIMPLARRFGTASERAYCYIAIPTTRRAADVAAA